jgi:hypothetical protein
MAYETRLGVDFGHVINDAKNVVDHVAQDGRKTVAITADGDDVDAIVAATASPGPELMDAVQRHGVIPTRQVFCREVGQAATGPESSIFGRER